MWRWYGPIWCVLVCGLVAAAEMPTVAKVVVCSAWQVTLLDSFSYVASAAGDRILVCCGNYRENSFLALYDGTGKERWRLRPSRGKFLSPQLSADGRRVLNAELWSEPPEQHGGKVYTKVVLADAATGRPLQGKLFGGAYDATFAQMSADGTRLLCHNMSGERSGSWARLYRIDGLVWKELWRLEKVSPPLKLWHEDPRHPGKWLGQLFDDAVLLPGEWGTLFGGNSILLQLDQQGVRHWELTAPKGSLGVAAVSATGELLVVRNDEERSWPWQMRRPGPDRGEVLDNTLDVRGFRLGVYLLGDWFKQPDPQAMRLLAGVAWPKGCTRSYVSHNEIDMLQGTAIVRDGDTAVLAVFSQRRAMLYRIPLQESGEGLPAPIPTYPLAGLARGEVWTACAPNGLLAVSAVGTVIDQYHSRARFALYDFYGQLLWEDGTHDGTQGEVALAANGTRLYAQAGNVLYAYTISRE